MARKKSVILTPTEKKAAVAAAKGAVKDAKAKLAAAYKARKALDAEFGFKFKTSDKDIAAAQKAVSAAEVELTGLTLSPPAAVPSPVGT